MAAVLVCGGARCSEQAQLVRCRVLQTSTVWLERMGGTCVLRIASREHLSLSLGVAAGTSFNCLLIVNLPEKRHGVLRQHRYGPSNPNSNPNPNSLTNTDPTDEETADLLKTLYRTLPSLPTLTPSSTRSAHRSAELFPLY